jgi:hypothetical protein
MFMVMFLAVALGSFLITSCDSPTNGDPGASGAPGSTYLNGVVSARDLEDAFNNNAVVRLQSGVTTVEGVVPAGRTLRVISNPAILAASSLEVKGTLEIIAGGSLDASYVTATAGYLKGSGSIIGAGGITLPYLGPAGALPEGGIHYDSANISAVKSAGSYRNSSSTAIGNALDNTGVSSIFALSDGPDELTARNITGLTYTAVPADKELTLTGAGNDVAVNLNIANGGTLIVAEGATLATNASGITITANDTTSNITINGTLDLGNAGDSVAGKVTNNGTISTITTTSATLVALVALPGTGEISSSGVVPLGAVAALSQDLVIEAGTITTHAIAAPFTGSKTITIEENGTLSLNAANTSIGATVVNEGTVATATTAPGFLHTIMDEIGGAVTSSGNVTGAGAITVPVGTVLTQITENWAGYTGPLTVNGEATFNAATFAALTSLTVAEGAALTADAATFALVTSLTLGEGVELDVPAATFAAIENLTLGEGVELTAVLASFDELESLSGAGELTVGSAVSATQAALIINSALHEATLASTAITGALTIPEDTIRTLTGVAVPDNTVTVNGTLIVGTSLDLKNTLTIGTNGRFALVGRVTLNHADAEIVSGTYEITPEGTETTGTLAGSNGAVVFESDAISGYDEADPLTDSAAILTFGTKDSELTITNDTTLKAVILDVAAKGIINVEEGKKLTLDLGPESGDYVASGGIFTVAVAGGTAGGAVKANAYTPKDGSGAFADADALADAKVLKLAADAGTDFGVGDLGAGATPGESDPAAGVITGGEAGGTTIDAADTFTVNAQNAIAATGV